MDFGELMHDNSIFLENPNGGMFSMRFGIDESLENYSTKQPKSNKNNSSII